MTIRDPPVPARCVIETVADTANLRKAMEKVRINRMRNSRTRKQKNRIGVAFRRLAEVIMSTGRCGLAHSLLNGEYTPSPVRGADIPKGNGKTRRLGIPTFQDQLVQQAILQVLSPQVDPTFSPCSYGYRPRMGALTAVHAVQGIIQAGYGQVVALDIEAFFDRVNHAIMLELVAKQVNCKRTCRLIQRFLTAGMTWEESFVPRELGTPQGSPLSPLLANIYLDPFDQHLTQQRIPFTRYADDVRIFCRTQQEAHNLLDQSTRFLSAILKLNVSQVKSSAGPVNECTFLGYAFDRDGRPRVADSKLRDAGEKSLAIARDRTFVNATVRFTGINRFITGWSNYFKLAVPDCNALQMMDDELFQALLEVHPTKMQRIIKNLSKSRSSSMHSSDALRGLGITGFYYCADHRPSERIGGNRVCTALVRGSA